MDRLLNTIRPYSWGSTTALSELMGTVPDGTPQAELWMGAHPAAPSRLLRAHGPEPLDALIRSRPAAELGEATLRRFGPRLPFLLKLLAVESPLSIQVHPDLAQAAVGHRIENAQGVPLDAPYRNYRDDNHKPEMIVALSGFEGLCGFKPPTHCADLLAALRLPELAPHVTTLREEPEEPALRAVFSAFLTAPATLVAAVAASVAREAETAEEDRPAWQAYDRVARARPGDPGLLAALMLQHVRLAPGEGIFLGAGVPHAYLRGLGVEIMASSDNVLRCGLTSKHVDTEELLRVVRATASPVRVLRPAARGAGAEEVYAAPVDDFRLSRVRLSAGSCAALDATAPQILVCTSGSIRLSSGSRGSLTLRPGESAYAPAGDQVTVRGEGEVFRATVDAGHGHRHRRRKYG
ncbi:MULTISPECIES: mannose-6-phosphate isomerase, class I [Streptomyces]|uniref:mannose-6-phosphate isomerase n=1 Tax=Streptomyces badius TaxID=1941 RepID=A0ABQ2T228_STRBA|nr:MULTISPECIES: mannose-6-phosphate isomerase, class I [Streptomyces]GGS47632.1 mannose-6-phosphate isomerase, class I [Streptomyces badius]